MAFKLKSQTWRGHTIGYCVVLKDGGSSPDDVVTLDTNGEIAMEPIGTVDAQADRSASEAANQQWRGIDIGTYTTGIFGTFQGDGGWQVPLANRYPWVDLDANGVSFFIAAEKVDPPTGSSTSIEKYGSWVGNPTNARGFGLNYNDYFHWVSWNNERVNSLVACTLVNKFSVLSRWDYDATSAYVRYLEFDNEDTTPVPAWDFSDNAVVGHEMLDPYVVASCVAAGQGGHKSQFYCVVMFEGQLTPDDHKTLHNSWWTELIDAPAPPTGGLVGPLAGSGGLAGLGGLAGRHGGLAG